MRIFIILISFCIFFISNAANALSTTEYVKALEQKLFGMTYENQTLEERVNRIEKQIYDNNYSGNPEERLNKIDKIYPKSEFEIGTIQHPQNLAEYNSEDEWYTQDYPEPSNYNNYPIISEIEMSIYKKDFKGEDIYNRLARLETELYGSVKNDLSLQERVESLKSVLPKKHYERFAPKNFGLDGFGIKQPTEYMADTPDVNLLINELEMETFHKTYSHENMQKRIDRLEKFYLGGISYGESDTERLRKIASITMNSTNMNDYFPPSKGSQWAGILMNLLMIGLGFLL